MAHAILINHGMPKWLLLFALQHAVQVCNCLPVMVDGSITTSLELLHQCQPNYKAIIYPIFSHGIFRQVRDGSCDRLQFEPQSQLAITIGRSELANGLMFRNPTKKRYACMYPLMALVGISVCSPRDMHYIVNQWP
jgi:hypothetical protein